MASVSNGTVRIQDTLSAVRTRLRRRFTVSSWNAVHTASSSPGVESSDSSHLPPPSCAGPHLPEGFSLLGHPGYTCSLLRLVLAIDRCAARDGLTLAEYAPLLAETAPATRRELAELATVWDFGLRELLEASENLALLDASSPQAPTGSRTGPASHYTTLGCLVLGTAILWLQYLAAANAAEGLL